MFMSTVDKPQLPTEPAGGSLVRKKVFVGMSGGVDSSVAALLLHGEGHDVTGVFIKVWQPDFIPCTAEDDRKDAMRVAARLGIPFQTFNFEKEYKTAVIDYLIAEYKAGRTPNPDVMCNREIKFGAFLREAKRQGADAIATGHYARIHESGPRSQESQFHLLAGIDKNKDQSYFLYTLGQDELAHTLFPIGEYTKLQVRAIAEKAGLPTAQKKDSQGLCFIGKLDMKEFLARFLPRAEGAVQDRNGKIIGTHDGAHYYTVGQRHGFAVRAESASQSPYYVVAKDSATNTLTVSHTPSQKTDGAVTLQSVSWTSAIPQSNRKYTARMRYRQPLMPCFVHAGKANNARVQFLKSPGLIPSGQALVVYDGTECIGGGTIR